MTSNGYMNGFTHDYHDSSDYSEYNDQNEENDCIQGH